MFISLCDDYLCFIVFVFLNKIAYTSQFDYVLAYFVQ